MGEGVGRQDYSGCGLLFILAIVCTVLRDNLLMQEAYWLISSLVLTNIGIYWYAHESSVVYLRGSGFAPWNSDFNKSSAYFLISTLSLLVLYSYDYPVIDLLVGGLFLWLGWRLLRSGLKRMHGITVEKKAIKALKALLKGRCRIETDVIIDGVGNIDVLISDFAGLNQRWVVEIKSWHGLRVTGNKRLVKMNGTAPYGSPIDQVLRQVDMIGHAKPLLWMPNAVKASSFVYHGVTVVNGDSSFLVKIISAK